MAVFGLFESGGMLEIGSAHAPIAVAAAARAAEAGGIVILRS
jgi:hypothetical protein